MSHFGAPSTGLQSSILAGVKHPWSCWFSLAQFGCALSALADTHPGGCWAVPAPYTSPASTHGPQRCHLQWQSQEVACHFLEQATLLVALGSPKGRVASWWSQLGPLCLAACEIRSREGFLILIRCKHYGKVWFYLKSKQLCTWWCYHPERSPIIYLRIRHVLLSSRGVMCSCKTPAREK